MFFHLFKKDSCFVADNTNRLIFSLYFINLSYRKSDIVHGVVNLIKDVTIPPVNFPPVLLISEVHLELKISSITLKMLLMKLTEGGGKIIWSTKIPLLPSQRGEQYSQTISFYMTIAAPLRQ
jgi:hypothetical protein